VSDNVKAVALWPRIREIRERRGREADDVRLVSQLGWLFFFNRITERQFEAGEWWAIAKCQPNLEPIRMALRKKHPSIIRTLDNLCVYDFHPCGDFELEQAKHALEALADHLRVEENSGGAINCHHCGKPIRERRRGKKHCDARCRVYGNRGKRNNGPKSVTG
jgi:hypothetical protein